ncbi:MAG: hypothetical protein JW737_00245 [Acidobacteria bacterium]|nr:hypothetical protein [Acidobacteriota bacterium]
MKKIFLIVVLIAVSFSIYAEDDYVIREVKWGMTKQQVKQSEDVDLKNEKLASLQYAKINVSDGIEMYLAYKFNNDALCTISYANFGGLPEDETAFTLNFTTIQNKLMEKYGLPNHLISPDHFIWNTNDFYIEHNLQKDKVTISHYIIYYEPAYFRALELKKKSATPSNL